MANDGSTSRTSRVVKRLKAKARAREPVHTVFAEPVRRVESGTMFRVWYEGELLLGSSRVPLHDAARALHDRGLTGRLTLHGSWSVNPLASVDIAAGAKHTIEDGMRRTRTIKWSGSEKDLDPTAMSSPTTDEIRAIVGQSAPWNIIGRLGHSLFLAHDGERQWCIGDFGPRGFEPRSYPNRASTIRRHIGYETPAVVTAWIEKLGDLHFSDWLKAGFPVPAAVRATVGAKK